MFGFKTKENILGSLRLIGHAAFEIWDIGVSLFFFEEKSI